MEKKVFYVLLLTLFQIILAISTSDNETFAFCELCDRFLDGDIKCSTTGFKYKGGQILQKTIIPFTVKPSSQDICKIEVTLRLFDKPKSSVQTQIVVSDVGHREGGMTMTLQKMSGHQMSLIVEGLSG